MRLWFIILALLSAANPARAEDAATVPRFVGFPVIIVNTVDGFRYTGLFAVSVRLGVRGEAAYKRLEELRPVLQDAINTAAFKLGRLYVDPRKPPPFKRMVSEIDAAVKPIIPQEKYKVLIMEVTTRPQ
jgi:hypothetical protein